MQKVKMFDAAITNDCLSDELIRLTVRGFIIELVVPIETKTNHDIEIVVKAAIIIENPNIKEQFRSGLHPY